MEKKQRTYQKWGGADTRKKTRGGGQEGGACRKHKKIAQLWGVCQKERKPLGGRRRAGKGGQDRVRATLKCGRRREVEVSDCFGNRGESHECENKNAFGRGEVLTRIHVKND